ncbi:hypothetical protein B0T13DRAFT_30322 [Neurospora crassa]|nr:hypothetical protein B0T13DRAFT_30322 [Neurospora crassa]
MPNEILLVDQVTEAERQTPTTACCPRIVCKTGLRKRRPRHCKSRFAIHHRCSVEVDEWKYHAVKMVPRLARGHGWPVDRTGSILPTGFRERVSILHTSLSIHLDGNVALALWVFGNIISGPMEDSSKKLGRLHPWRSIPYSSGRSGTPPRSHSQLSSSCAVCCCVLSSTVVAVAAGPMSIWEDWRTKAGSNCARRGPPASV